ncbi:MAG: universal stress protein [Gammaproteobacteria bacterium]|jgi:nucleotide-binding universal stress UspA family protein|nr:universal stress protein [Gammaproteobacteria bacterium]MBQ0774092.1 universal stress protein [Gammaproteobacteria bacterium]|tara:strand:+ start:1889 stop:2728 length:840 start_codon:yes stop_codon:yes gene_type:complete
MTQVIACIDGSDSASAVCDYAAWAATQLSAPLLLLHVLDEARYPSEANLSGSIGLGAVATLQKELADLDAKRNQLALEQGQLMLEAAKEKVIADGVVHPVLRQRHGELLASLKELEEDTRLLVIGKQGEAHPDPGAQVGDNVERVVRSMHRPVLITTGEFEQPTSVMLAFDGSATMAKAIDMISASALFKGLPCHLVTVGNDSDALQGAAKQLRNAGHDVTVAFLSGDVENALHQYQQQKDISLVVMGAYGHSRIREFFVGSTTNALLRGATVPHLILR